MASAGRSRQQVVLPEVKDPPPPALSASGAQHQMNRPHNYAESAYFIHQRYEDTALVIFQQQAKEKKKAKPGQYTPLSQTSASPQVAGRTPQHLHLPPPVSNVPGKNSLPEAPSSPHATTNSSLGSSSPAGTRSPHWDTDSTTGASSVANSSAIHAAGDNVSLSTGATRSRANTYTSVTESELSELDSPVTHRSDPFAAKSVDPSRGSPVDPHQKSPDLTNPSVNRHDTTTNGVGVSGLHDDVRVKNSDVTEDDDVQNSTPAAIVDGVAHPSEAHAGSVPSDRVSGGANEVEVGRYGSSGVVARRKVVMSKADSHRTQSKVCAVM